MSAARVLSPCTHSSSPLHSTSSLRTPRPPPLQLADPATTTMTSLLLESALLLRSLNAALAATYNLHHLLPPADAMAEQSLCSPVLASALRKLMGQSDREDGDRADADRERADVADADGADADRAGAKSSGVETSRSEEPGAETERGASGSGEAAEGSERGGNDCNRGDNGLKGRAQEREGEGVAVGGDEGGKQSGGGSGTVTSGGDGVGEGVADPGGGSREEGGKGELSVEDGTGSQVGKRDTTTTTGVTVTDGSVSLTEEEVEAVKVAAKGLVTAYWTSFLSMHKLCHVELCAVLRQQWVVNQTREAAPWVYASASPMQTEQLFGLDRWPDVTTARQFVPPDKQSDLALLSAALARQVRAAMAAVPSSVLAPPTHHCHNCIPNPASSLHHTSLPPHPSQLALLSAALARQRTLPCVPSCLQDMRLYSRPLIQPLLFCHSLLPLSLTSISSPPLTPTPHTPTTPNTPSTPTTPASPASFAAASIIDASNPASTFPSPPLPISPSLLPTTSTSLDSLLSSLHSYPPASIPFCLSSPHRPPIPSHLNHLTSLSPAAAAAAAAAGGGTESPRVSAAGSTGGEGGRKATRGKHVVVFVHGYQGHRMDLRLVRDSWRLLDPDIECLMAESNETNSAAPHSPSPSSHSPARAPDLSGVEAMGARLAHEVVTALRSMFGPIDRPNRKNLLQRLSFVGYSIGNLVVRAALADDSMRPYLPYLHLYLSFCGPHLGYMYHSNSLVTGGMWLLKRLDPSSLMRQLSFSDSLNVRDSCIYRLSQDPPSMPLCCTFHCPPIEPPQDEYVPYHSARLEVFGAVLRDARLGGVYTSMVEGCLAPFLSHPSWTSGDRSFIRCDVNFELPQQQRNLNRLLGRAAHIEFLEFPAFIQFFFATHMHLLANGAE
ncbi:unnamed protein product [Closterium sp. Naga37s-1]|nr:unnamed protein product [Closterium sp. Naga37s-1]